MKYEEYFTLEVPERLKSLSPEHTPKFGIMTPQHMIEHLIWVTKASVKNVGGAPEELSKGQLGFMKFIDKGAEFQYRPSDKTTADLPSLKYNSLDEALAELPKAIKRMKTAIDTLSDGETFFNPMMGILTGDQMALFHRQHYAWHLEKQFGL